MAQSETIVLSAIGKLRTFTLRTVPGNDFVDPVAQSQFEREQRRLSHSLTDEERLETVAGECFAYLQSYLEARAAAVWRQLIVRTVDGLDAESELGVSDLRARTLLFATVGAIIKIVRQRPDASLNEVVESLEEIPGFENHRPILRQDGSDLYVHLVFHILGWVTTLWDPVLDEKFQYLRVANDKSKSRKRSLLHIPTIRNLDVRLNEANVPVHQLLARFGDLFPTPDSLLSEHDIARFDIESAVITAAYVSFHNLKNVLKLRLQWTLTLNQHLEYDRRRNVLHVFAVPSICAFNLQLANGSILAKLFDNYRGDRDNESSSNQYADFRVYLGEILLSYRLIFGMHKKSQKQFQQLLSNNPPPGKIDPMIEILCTKDNKRREMRELFDELGMENLGDYVSLEEFQFLGKRLLRLERISRSQNPSGLRRFFNDRRDATTWFVTWAVIILGGGTFLLQFVQAFFQIWNPVDKNNSG